MALIEFPHNRPRLLRKRTYAFTVDLFMIVVINKLLGSIFINILSSFFYHLSIYDQKRVYFQLPLLYTALLLSVFMGYFIAAYTLGQGQTIGKLIFSLKVSGSKQGCPTFIEALSRTIGYFFCYMTGVVLFALPYFRKDSKGIPDFISQTSVQILGPLPTTSQAEEEQKLAA